MGLMSVPQLQLRQYLSNRLANQSNLFQLPLCLRWSERKTPYRISQGNSRITAHFDQCMFHLRQPDPSKVDGSSNLRHRSRPNPTHATHALVAGPSYANL